MPGGGRLGARAAYLAKGDDEALAEAAQRDLAGPQDAYEQLAVGDGWSTLSEQRKATESRRLQQRALLWYRKAKPALSGFALAKVEKRLEALTILPTYSVLKFNGTSSYVLVA